MATDKQLASMWTEVVNLLKLEFLSDEEEDQFYADFVNLNEWLRRQYGPKGMTCEEVRLAYNHLVMEELTKAEGRTLEAFRKLDPRHVGEVLAAYLRKIENDLDVNRVLSSGLYLPQPAEPKPEQINAFMERALTEAIRQTAQGIDYNDIGNGLYTWLYQQGRIKPTNEEWVEWLELAKGVIRIDLAEQKTTAAEYPAFEHLRHAIGQRLASVMREEGDYKKRVRQEAMRLCLLDFLQKRAGDIINVKILRPTPTLPASTAPAPPKAFSHAAWIESLKEQLPTMKDEPLSDLQLEARRRNVLDVYELTTAEWNKRQVEKKPAKPAKK